MRELRECPFCGGEATLQEQNGIGRKYWEIACHGCEFTAHDFEDKADAITAWNRRPASSGDVEVRAARYDLGYAEGFNDAVVKAQIALDDIKRSRLASLSSTEAMVRDEPTGRR